MDKRRLRGARRTPQQRARDRKLTGRPPLPPGEKLSALVKVNMTPKQKRELEAEAQQAGLTTSQYLVRCWMGKKEGE